MTLVCSTFTLLHRISNTGAALIGFFLGISVQFPVLALTQGSVGLLLHAQMAVLSSTCLTMLHGVTAWGWKHVAMSSHVTEGGLKLSSTAICMYNRGKGLLFCPQGHRQMCLLVGSCMNTSASRPQSRCLFLMSRLIEILRVEGQPVGVTD